MKQKYLIRLDDACPTMDKVKWGRMEELLNRYCIAPMVGVIPHNEDPMLECEPEDKDFWNKVLSWDQRGWKIALHGYNHCYSSNNGMKGLNPMWNRSEFAGLPLEEQCEKVRKGVAILREHGVNPDFFFCSEPYVR
jgi:predicted deacetylase